MDNAFHRLWPLEDTVAQMGRRLFAAESVIAALQQSLAKNWGAGGALMLGGALVPALTDGFGILAGSMASPASATVTLLVADPSGGALSPGSETVDVLNTEGVAYGPDTQVQIYQFMGFWYVAGGDCS